MEMRYRLAGGVGESWCDVRTMNFSAAGVRFRSDGMLDPGALLELQVVFPDVGQPLSLRGTVVWSQLHASGVTELGVEFLDLTQTQQAQIDRLVQFVKPSS